VDDCDEWFGDQVIFAKVDGPKNYYLASHYKAQSYPHFVMLDSEQQSFQSFTSNQRTYHSMLDWILQKTEGKVKVLPSAKSSPFEDENLKPKVVKTAERVVQPSGPYQGGP